MNQPSLIGYQIVFTEHGFEQRNPEGETLPFYGQTLEEARDLILQDAIYHAQGNVDGPRRK